LAFLKIDVIAAGRLKNGSLFDLGREYQKRIQWSVNIHEIESRKTNPREAQVEEHAKIAKLIKDDAYLILMDERGKTLKSMDFAKALEKQANNGRNHIQFVIGGADGLSDELRKRAGLVLSFGAQTWPHMLARIMLLEQIYRAQQILKGHPYHRE
jgi:23S rRNA (pseudouridine1915-N3)-methyltransferase